MHIFNVCVDNLFVDTCIISLFVVIAHYSFDLTNFICNWTHLLQLGSYFIRLKDEELNLRQQVRELKSEQGTVSMSEEFAKYMKLQRKIDRLVEQVKKMGKIC